MRGSLGRSARIPAVRPLDLRDPQLVMRVPLRPAAIADRRTIDVPAPPPRPLPSSSRRRTPRALPSRFSDTALPRHHASHPRFPPGSPTPRFPDTALPPGPRTPLPLLCSRVSDTGSRGTSLPRSCRAGGPRAARAFAPVVPGRGAELRGFVGLAWRSDRAKRGSGSPATALRQVVVPARELARILTRDARSNARGSCRAFPP